MDKTNISRQGYRASENQQRGRKVRIIKDFVDDKETFPGADSLILIDFSEVLRCRVGARAPLVRFSEELSTDEAGD
jgi:hypothetical protein